MAKIIIGSFFTILAVMLGAYYMLRQNSVSLDAKDVISSEIVDGKAFVAFADMGLKPGQIKVPAGTIVIWENKETRPHQLRFENFYSNTIDPGQSYQHLFMDKGEFLYICDLHSYLKGKVTVE